MLKRSKFLVSILSASLAFGALAGCADDPKKTERWVATQNTNVEIDWDQVNEAYKLADGPQDLERRINEIYEGDEVISVAVEDLDEKTQVVTGFFDKNTDGKVDEAEKIFTIQRRLTGEGQGEYQTSGHGAYAGYTSPMFGIFTGMLLGSMMSSMFMPSYVPMYTQPYTTTASRNSELRNQRSSYRTSNPQRFAKPSQTGRNYGGGAPSRSSPPRSRGGGRFGVRRVPGVPIPVRLVA